MNQANREIGTRLTDLAHNFAMNMKSLDNFRPPTLKTRRLILRELAADDLDDVVRIVGNYDVSKWLEPVPYPYTKKDAEQFFRDVQDGKLGFNWAIDIENRFIGVIAAGPGLGSWFCPTVWGKGLMSEAAEAVVSAYFEHANATEIPSRYFEENIGSARVLKRVGFIETKACLCYSLARNAEVKARQMLLTRDRWAAQTREAVNRP